MFNVDTIWDVGPRQTGKTTRMIEHLAETQKAYAANPAADRIVVFTPYNTSFLVRLIQQFAPYPDQVMIGGHENIDAIFKDLRGRWIKGFYLDEPSPGLLSDLADRLSDPLVEYVTMEGISASEIKASRESAIAASRDFKRNWEI